MVGVSEAGQARGSRRQRKTPSTGFLAAALREKGLQPGPRADKRTLVRRVYLDLIGLPPSPEETRAFLAADAPDAWERLGREPARLAALRRALGAALARPGALRPTPAATSATSTGPRCGATATTSSDAFNNDKRYDDFIREQIAGDEIAPQLRRSPRRHRLSAHGVGQQRQGRADADGRARRQRGHHGADLPGHDGAMRALPQPQVRPDSTKRLLPDAGRVFLDGRRGLSPCPAERRRRAQGGERIHRRTSEAAQGAHRRVGKAAPRRSVRDQARLPARLLPRGLGNALRRTDGGAAPQRPPSGSAFSNRSSSTTFCPS